MNALAWRGGVALVALALVWRVLQVNLVLYDDNGRPRLPGASAPSVGEASPNDDVLRRALRQNPTHIEALLLLARERENGGDLASARAAYQAAFRLAPLDRGVLGNGAEFFLRQGRIADALLLLDRLVDSYPDARGSAFPVLAQLLAEGREPEAWKTMLARGPAWVGDFIVSSCRRAVAPALLVPLSVDRIKAGRATAQEAGCLVDRLRDADQWQQAYQLWLNTLPRERLADVGHVFNGGFEYAPSGMGFDWRPTLSRERDAGHAVEIPQAVGVSGKRALHVIYNGKRQAGLPIAQYLAAAPGRYQLAGLARPQSITAGRGVQWTLRCVKGGKAQAPLAASERFLGSSEWRPFAFDVVIPADCAGQVLQLEPVGASDGPVYLAGSAWFDDLVLRRR